VSRPLYDDAAWPRLTAHFVISEHDRRDPSLVIRQQNASSEATSLVEAYAITAEDEATMTYGDVLSRHGWSPTGDARGMEPGWFTVDVEEASCEGRAR
jgi:hypothetical protein